MIDLMPMVAALLLSAGPADDPVVIPLDFASPFDDGATGRKLGDAVWAKLRKQGGCVLPEAMQDVRDAMARKGFHPDADTPLEQVRAFARGEQAGDLALWGSVVRASGASLDEYDVRIRVADLAADPPRLLYERDARTATVSEIPHVHLQAALEAIAARTGAAPLEPAKGARPVPAPRAAAGENLVVGHFNRGTDHPEGWKPLPPGVTWVGDGRKAGNRLIRFTQDEGVAGTTGVLYYSDFFPVEAGATYRFRCRWNTSGSTVKVFIKAYDEFPTKASDAAGQPLRFERREVYRSQQNLAGDPGAWHEHAQGFTPKHTKFTPRRARVMLYAYWPAGTVEWDDIEVVKVAPAKGAKPAARTR